MTEDGAKTETGTHVVHFEPQPQAGLWWAWCKCGWINCHVDRQELSSEAARHDIWKSA